MEGLDKMTLGSWRYYDHDVVQGLENYFAGAGEEAGRWVGRGAAEAGLVGEVDGGALRLLFDEGRHPATAEALGQPYVHRADRATVTGYALSFSPPKSISLLWALGDERVAVEVRAAHDDAVAAALSFLEEHAAFARSGKGGVFQADTSGLLAAAFVHRSSRAGDPQIHTHVLLANKVRRSDGLWRSLDGREVFATQKPAGMLYNAALRAELTRRLGAEFGPVNDKGQAEVLGVPPGLITRFSQRRRQVLTQGAERIAKAEAALGRPLTDAERAEAYQRAALDRRPGKAPAAESEPDLRARWADAAAEAGHPGQSWIPETLDRVPLALGLGGDLSPEGADAAVGVLTERHSTFGRAEVAKVVAPLVPADVPDAQAARAWLEAGVSRVLGHPEVVALSCPLFAEVPDSLRRADGLPTAERHGEPRWTTHLTLEREARVLAVADRGRRARVGVVDAEPVGAAVANADLSTDQAAAVGRLCRAGEAVACLVGPAGTGKTRALRAAAAAWRAGGYRAHGVAVSAMAAGILGTEAEIASDTLARFLGAVRRRDVVLGARDVVLCDEAGMVTTSQLAELVGATADAGAKLVLVGDDRQLSPVGAGGLFRLVIDQVGAARLGQVRRFAAAWEGPASLRLRAGDAGVLDVYEAHGRIRGGNRADMVEVAFEAWQRARADGESVAVLAPDQESVDALVLRARAHRVAAGEVDADGVLAAGQLIGVGDEVVTCRNDRRLRTTTGAWVRNGDRWVVTARRPDASLSVKSLTGAGDAVLPGAYVAEHARLAYAVTVHKAQGITVDRAVLLADGRLTAELTYVGLTRGRLENLACVVVENHARRRGTPATPVEVLAAALARSGVEPAATQVVRDQLARSEDMAVLYPMLAQARAAVDAVAGPDRSADVAVLRRQAARLEAVEAQLRAASSWLAGVEAELATAAARADELRSAVGAGQMDRWRRRSRRDVVRAAGAELDQVLVRRHELVDERNQAVVRVGSLETDLDAARWAAEGLAELEVHRADREALVARQPAEVVWERELRRRIAERTKELGTHALHDPHRSICSASSVHPAP